MLKYTTTTLKKIEDVFTELGYEVRFEKGSFQSGYCLVEAKKIVVVNRFFDTEARVNALLEILTTLAPSPENLSEKSREVLKKGFKLLSSDD